MSTSPSSKSLQKTALCFCVHNTRRKHIHLLDATEKKKKSKICKLFLPADMSALLMQE